jgi:hypothetical protein
MAEKMIEPDVVVYPDSGKIGIFVGSAPGGPRENRTLHKYLELTPRLTIGMVRNNHS